MPPELLPSKKVITAAVILALIIGWIFWVPTTSTFKLKNLEFWKKQNAKTEKTIQAAVDSDMDGLKDWEEALWKTDPHNSDSDFDGTPDGEEIAMGRNPAVSGPDDLLPTVAATSTENVIGYQPGGNLTQYVAGEFLARYLAMKSRGIDPVESLPQEIANEITERFYADEFSAADIKTGSDDSAAVVKSYINSLGRIVTDNLTLAKDDELVILNDFAASEDPSALARLSGRIDAYKKITADLQKITAPAALADLHSEALNIANNAWRSLTDLQKIEEDPALSFGALEEYNKVRGRYVELADALVLAAETRGIALKSSDPGYLFVKIGNAF